MTEWRIRCVGITVTFDTPEYIHTIGWGRDYCQAVGGPDMVTSSFLRLRLTCHCFREVYMPEQLLLRGCTHIQISDMWYVTVHRCGMLSP